MASETTRLDDLHVEVIRKPLRRTHLVVHPPDGRVTLTTPPDTRPDVARAYVIEHLGWIRRRREQLLSQAREAPRDYVEQESHYLWGERYLLHVEEADAAPEVRLAPKHVTLQVRPSTPTDKRAAVMHEWYKEQLHAVVPERLAHYTQRMGLTCERYYLRRMKTKWGSANPAKRTIRLNTELAKKPRACLDYLIVHELAHFLVPHHGPEFLEVLETYYPEWEGVRTELNALPL